MKKLIFLYLFFFSLFFQLSYGQSDDCITNDCCGDGTYWSEADARCIVAFYGDMDVDGYIGTTDLLDFLSKFGTYLSNGDDIDIELDYGCGDVLACNFNPNALVTASHHCLYPEDYGWCNCTGDVDDACGNCGGDGSTCFQNCGDDAYYDGYNYATVQLGNDCWFAENCRYIPGLTVDDTGYYSDTQPKYYVYGATTGAIWNPLMGDYPPANYVEYGVLYNSWAITSTSAVCPNGWHISTETNWKDLELWLGLSVTAYENTGWRGTDDEGELLKEVNWGDGSVTPVGFDALPGGAFSPYYGDFTDGGNGGHWWSINDPNLTSGDEDSPLDPSVVYDIILERRHLNSSHSSIYRDVYYAAAGLSVRCVKTKLGCVDSGACNYDNNAQVDDGSCLFYGAPCDDGNPNTFLDLINNYCICAGELLGCTDNDPSTNGGVACNYDPTAQLDDGSCEYLTCAGCMDNDPYTNGGVACNYDPSATIDSPSICLYPNDFCDDGDPQTINTTYDSACNCTGGTQVFVCGDDLVNFDNHDYSTVQIGNQCWFSENCRYLPIVNMSSDASSVNAMYYVYGYNGTNALGNMVVADAMQQSNYDDYGALYNFAAVTSGYMCPSGWHVPTDGEWNTLEINLGLPLTSANQTQYRGIHGKDMRSTNSAWVQATYFEGTNNSGMTIEPGGVVGAFTPGAPVFGGMSYTAKYWTSTAYGGSAWARRFNFNENGVQRKTGGITSGYSVRCVQD